MKRWRALRTLLDSFAAGREGGGERLRGIAGSAWPSVLASANEHWIAPALYSELRRSGNLRFVPEDVRAYLALIHQNNVRRNLAIRRQASELLLALNAERIRPLILKGVLALVTDHDRDPGARMMSDIDIVVAREERSRAEGVLRALGYGAASRYPDGHHAVAEFKRPGDPAAVDLHIELIDQPYLLRGEEAIGRSRMLDLQEGGGCAIPTATPRVLHTLLHAQVHHLGQYYRGDIVLRQLHDFCWIAEKYAGSIDWREIDGRMAEQRMRPVLDSYLLAGQRLFGLAWPLDRAPCPAARLHMTRCRFQLCAPSIGRALKPSANLRSAFAWHRMRAKYGPRGGPAAWRAAHLHNYLGKHGTSEAWRRLVADRGCGGGGDTPGAEA